MFKRSSNLITCDVLAVDDLSVLEESNSKEAVMQHEMLVCRLLGKRVASLDWFKSSWQKRTSTASVKIVPAVKTTKLALVVSGDFKRRHPAELRVLDAAVALPNSKWSMVKEPAAKKLKQSDVAHLDSLADLHTIVKKTKIVVDRARSTASGRFARIQQVA